MVATAALDALDRCIEPADAELLKEQRCAASQSVQHTARFMLEKHFGEHAHREIYLSLLMNEDPRAQRAAAIGLAATGEPEDHQLLLSARLGARSKLRQQLLGAAASLERTKVRDALFEDVGSELRGVSKRARKLLGEQVLDFDADEITKLLGSSLPHVRRNALWLTARLSHWTALPAILRGTRDPDASTADTANGLVQQWISRHFHGIYRAPEPSQAQRLLAQAELTACAGHLARSDIEALERALAGE